MHKDLHWWHLTASTNFSKIWLYGHFKWQTSKILYEKTWKWLWKENLKRETESLSIAAQNNAIRTNYVQSKIDKMQQNSKCRLCSERNETINHTISECRKLKQKVYKTELCKVIKCLFVLWHINLCTLFNSKSIFIRTNSSISNNSF